MTFFSEPLCTSYEAYTPYTIYRYIYIYIYIYLFYSMESV
jgi:hypothetical protein